MTAPSRGSTLRLATRGSPLALAQARIVGDLLTRATGGEVRTEIVVVETVGDRAQDVPLHEIGGQGIFVTEVERAVLDGRAEAAVHSAKDLPASLLTGDRAEFRLAIAAVPERADARDALVGASLARLRPGARVATGSVRRRAQLSWLRPGLMFGELRGNMATRLSKVPDGGAVVVAMAALDRLGWSEQAAEILSPRMMLPQVGQGTIAVCTRPDDSESMATLAAIEHGPSRLALTAERAYLAGVGGGCELPVGAHAVVSAEGTIVLDAMIASLDGHVIVRESASGTDAEALGAALSAAVLDGAGGRSLLEPIAMATRA